MNKSVKGLIEDLQDSLSEITPVDFADEQVTLLAEKLYLLGYRQTEVSGSFLAKRPDGLTKRSENLDQAKEFAGAQGQVLQRRQVTELFDVVE